MPPRSSCKAVVWALLMTLQGCSLAPAYQAPTPDLPAHYTREARARHPVNSPSQVPAHWWQLFADPTLDTLQERLTSANPNLAAAVAHNDAAAAQARGLHGLAWPQVSASAAPLRQRQSDNRPLRGSTQPSVYDSDTLGLSLSFDLDLWGKLRNQVAAGDARAQASAADLAAARLSLQRQLAILYVQVRGLDAQHRLLDSALDSRTRLLALISDRYQGDIASRLDLDRAQARLAQTRASLDALVAQRNLATNAIAELVGAMPQDFTLAPATTTIGLVDIPSQLPGALLRQRPEIIAAERRVYAANAGIGVARAAWYPDFSLSALAGGQTQGSGNLLAAANRYWAIGPLLQLPVFDAGRRTTDERRARAEFDEAAAHYHATVLAAVREVQDNLERLHDDTEQARDLQDTVSAAADAERIAGQSYRQGALSLLDVLTAQLDALQARQALQDLETRQLQAQIGLITALGGGWQAPAPG